MIIGKWTHSYNTCQNTNSSISSLLNKLTLKCFSLIHLLSTDIQSCSTITIGAMPPLASIVSTTSSMVNLNRFLSACCHSLWSLMNKNLN
ncbi:uncharacterized protein LOC110431734 [Sorghum bicolor]|uniref:uncharacterized protein LOC110431734 n=1 Tax=Sorghum bicolor TaxID=4558 RepID=UPI000B425615|nr:uncharacterized protein LOC110431734 [Sorghum bicolor]|eukprot:XP_021306866.1 uncharacterized protein LOC110431734 [Sorghum bicolor]